MSNITEIRNLAKDIISAGGDLSPLIIPAEFTNGWALTNPSILVDGDEILVNVRSVEYIMILADKSQNYWSRWGPLTYCHTENEAALKTINYLCKLNKETLEVEKFARIDTSKLDTPPVWEFHGLEDARLVKWDGKLYGIGVRRDIKTNGEGRMQYQEIDYSFEGEPYAKEISRNRIQAPVDFNSYCEKNWMPILEKPHHFVKWSNPTEVVVANLSNNSSSQSIVREKFIHIGVDLRGGTQLIKWGNGWLAITHELQLMRDQNEFGHKDSYYFNRFVYWNENFEIVKTSEAFSFMDARIEFVTGLDHLDNDNVIVTFGAADSAGFVIRIPKTFINNFLTQTW